MNNFENDLFSGEDFNNYFNSLDKDNFANNNNNNIDAENNINLEDLNIKEDEESLKNSLELSKDKKSQNEENYTNSINSKNQNNNMLKNYINRLKSFGFPDIGDITLSDNPKIQEKTYKFFDYIINIKANRLDDFQNYKRNNELLQKKCEELEILLSKYKKEVSNLRNELKTYSKEKNNYEFKSNKLKEQFDKQINQSKKENIYLNNKISKISLEKRAIEEKYQSLAEMLNKYDINKEKIINTVEMTEYIQKNNILNTMNKISGAEKLAQTLKGGYNDSLRELLFEISALKNFIYDYHVEIASMIDNHEDINKEMLNMSFLDTVSDIKEIFNINMNKLKEKLGFFDNNEMQFSNLNNCLNNEDQDE